MKHKLGITLIILGMFLVAQFIGIYVVSQNAVPAFLSSDTSVQQGYGYYFFQLIMSFAFALLIFVLITKYKLKLFMRMWFFLVVFIAISLSMNAFLKDMFTNSFLVAAMFGFGLAILKLVRPSIIIHNATELLIYPGIATLFVQILNPLYALLLLILISIYDMWAVWKSGLMQKMAKFQMNELKIFGGFFIPYITKEIRDKINSAKIAKNKKKLNNVRLPVAILGGGDIVFPIITAGVFMLAYGIVPALYIIFGALAGLGYLLSVSEKKKFYPAMPYITSGIFLGLLIWLLFRII
jgi:presenilin-like A22 family membrane protease